MGTQPSFFHHVFKGRNIGDCLFAYLEDIVFSRWGQVLWEEFASVGANSCQYKMTPFYMGGNYDNELLPMKVYLSTLMKAVVYSVQTYSFHYIYYIAPICVIPQSIHDMAQQ